MSNEANRKVPAMGGCASARLFTRPVTVRSIPWVGPGVALILFAATAYADEPKTIVDDERATTTLTAFADKSPLSGDELNTQRARAAIEVDDVLIINQETTGGVWGNTATGNTTGDNIISDSAFTDTAGFVSTIQNTGNNVLIQNSTIINVAVDP